jgi:hypothetical protein
MAGDEDFHAVSMTPTIGAIGQHGGATDGEETPHVVNYRAADVRRSQRACY